MAYSFFKFGKKVLLVDFDLRNPTLHELFSLPHGKPGLLDFLSSGNSFEEVFHEVEPGFGVSASGTRLFPPGRFLKGKRLEEFFEKTFQKYDMVVFSSPPVVSEMDSIILSSYVDFIVLITQLEKEKKDAFNTSLRKLSPYGKRLGIFLAGTSRRNSSSFLRIEDNKKGVSSEKKIGPVKLK